MSKKYIADDTREAYQKSVMRLVVWLYDNERRCLHDTTSVSELNDVIVNLHNANELGKEEEEQEQSEEQRKQTEKVRVKALAQRHFKPSNKLDGSQTQQKPTSSHEDTGKAERHRRQRAIAQR